MVGVFIDRPVHFIDNECSVISSNMRINGQDVRIRHKVSRGPVSQTADTFLTAGLFPAMKMGHGRPVSCHENGR
jgi:hypothetical protein